MTEVVVISQEDEIYPKDRLTTRFPNLPTLHALGNLNLLHLPLTALFCSRKCPGDAILKAYDLAQELHEKEVPVISGFHTPVEKDLLEILLKGNEPVVICPARGLEGMKISPVVRRVILNGNVLLLSIFDKKDSRINREHCIARNNLVAALANTAVFIHHNQSGILAPLHGSLLMADKPG